PPPPPPSPVTQTAEAEPLILAEWPADGGTPPAGLGTVDGSSPGRLSESTDVGAPSALGAPELKRLASNALRRWGAMLPKSPPQTVFGIPLAALRNDSFVRRTFLTAAAALVITRLLPVGHIAGKTIFAWSSDPLQTGRGGPGLWLGLIWPLAAAMTYAVAAHLPKSIAKQVPAVVLRWAPFLVAFLSIGITHCTVAVGGAALLIGLKDWLPNTIGLLAWAYPVLVFGLMARIQDPTDGAARLLILVGSLLSSACGLASIDGLLALDMPIILIIHGVLFLLVVAMMLASMVFAIPAGIAPRLGLAEPFLPFVTAALVAWPAVSALLVAFGFATSKGSGNASLLLLFPHLLVMQIAYFGVLLVCAPRALDAIKKLFGQAGRGGG
ncbi:MAG: hypothetical protein V2A73_10660, partial [Pseudomonadota bacterium]